MAEYVLVEAKTKSYITQLWYTYHNNIPKYELHKNIKYAKRYSYYLKNTTNLKHIKKDFGLDCFWHKLTKKEIQIIFQQECKNKVDKYQTIVDSL